MTNGDGKNEQSEIYSVKSTYQLLTQDFSVAEINLLDAKDIMWSKLVSLKDSVFACKLLQNRLPTKDNLFRRGGLTFTYLACAGGCYTKERFIHLCFECLVFGTTC